MTTGSRLHMLVRSAVPSFLLALVCAGPALPQQMWTKTYGGTGHDYGQSVQQTSDGGHIAAGYTTSFGDSDQVYLVKTNASGDTLWTRAYGGSRLDEGFSVRQTTDGGYIVAGWTTSFGDSAQVYLVKTRSSGDTLWTRAIGASHNEYGYAVQQTADGGYIVTGVTTSFGNGQQAYLVKTNASGDTLWTRSYGGAAWDYAYSVQQTLDGGYILAGGTSSFGSGIQAYLIKTNASGDTAWTRTYGGASDDRSYCVQQTRDTGYIAVGVTYALPDSYQVYLVKTNRLGDTLWTRAYGGARSEYGNGVQQTADGGYIVVGYTNSIGAGGVDVYLVKTNSAGDTLWTSTFGGANDERAFSVQQTVDGGYVAAGYTLSFGPGSGDVYLIKTDANGDVGVIEQEPGQRRAQGGLTVVPAASVFYDVAGRMVGTLGRIPAGVYIVRQATTAAMVVR